MKNAFILFIALFTITLASSQNKGEKSKYVKINEKTEVNVYNVNVADFNKELSKKEGVLIDVRTPDEYAQGHIPGAINIDWKNKDSFYSGLKEIAKDKPVLIYCQSGYRSGLARNVLEKMMFTTIYNLKKGIKSWKEAEMPIEK